MEHKQLKIAAVTDDGEMIHRHFGRAKFYTIYTVEDGQIVSQEQVEKAAHQHGHHHGHQQHSNVEIHEPGEAHAGPQEPGHNHDDMFAPIRNCDVLLSRGMGYGAHNGLNAIGVQPIITDIPRIEDAVQAYLDGTIVDHPEKLH